MLQKCIVNIQKLILINTWLFQIMKKEVWVINPVNLFLEAYNDDDWFENKKQADTTKKSDIEESTDIT